MRDEMLFLIGFLGFLTVMLWIIRAILMHRRWNRMAKTQMEAHSKLVERFQSSQDLLAYMQTEAGKRFLESAPIALEVEPRPELSYPYARILWSVQAGLILGVAGAGLLFLRSRIPDAEQALLLFGTLAVALGIGFLLSAGASFALSKSIGLLNGPSARGGTGAAFERAGKGL
jgi:hypothetical protein